MNARRAPTQPPAYEPPPWVPLRAFLESPDFCGLTLSPVVAAIADAADGAPVTSIDDATCRRIFAVPRAALRARRPRPNSVIVIAGAQGGKTTRLGAPAALHAAVCVPTPNAMRPKDGRLVRVGRPPRALIVAPDKDLADSAFETVKGYVTASAVLREMMMDALPAGSRARQMAERADEDEYGGPARKVVLRRSDGVIVEIVVKAGLKRGAGARSAPLVGFLLDEACFMDEEGAAVSDAEILRAVEPRLVTGAQAWLVSTPWEESIGVAMEFVRARDAAPEGERQRESLVVGGSAEHNVSTLDLFPGWDPDGSKIARAMRDPVNKAREVDGVPLASGSSRWFPPAVVARAFALPPWTQALEGRGAGGDFAFESDYTAQSVVDRHGDRYDLRADRVEVPGAEGLKPSATVHAGAEFVKAHGVTRIMGDAHYRKSVEEHLNERGVQFVDAPAGPNGKWEAYKFTLDLMLDARLRLAGASNPERLKANLGRVLRRPRAGGRWEIYVPRSAGRGHADDVSSLILAALEARDSFAFASADVSDWDLQSWSNPRGVTPALIDGADMWTNPRAM